MIQCVGKVTILLSLCLSEETEKGLLPKLNSTNVWQLSNTTLTTLVSKLKSQTSKTLILSKVLTEGWQNLPTIFNAIFTHLRAKVIIKNFFP